MRNITENDVRNYIIELEQEFPKLKIHNKKSWWLRFIFSLPGIKNLKWDDATQCIGNNIWLSNEWKSIAPAYQLSTLRHERQHVIWFQKHTLILASILYLFFIFPIGLAYYRAVFERAGYKESLRTYVECFGPVDWVKKYGWKRYKNAFMGWTYLKMWPFPKKIRKWYEEDWAEAVRMSEIGELHVDEKRRPR